MNVWFTSDTHLGHKLIRNARQRPENYEWNEVLPAWKALVRPGDVMYHLGDFTWHGFDWKKWLYELGCKNIHLVIGNHDEPKELMHPYIVSKSELKYIKLGEHNTSVMLCHYPMASWRNSHHGGFHLHGHTHGRVASYGRRLDVGCDAGPRQWAKKEIPADFIDNHIGSEMGLYSWDLIYNTLKQREIIGV